MILRIAGQPVDGASYFELRERLRKDGETVHVEFQRGKKSMDIPLRLRRLV